MNVHTPIQSNEIVTIGDIETAAEALKTFALLYRHTPRMPECDDILKTRRAQFFRAIRDMRDVLPPAWTDEDDEE